jgi:hypothetical protein
VRTLIKQNLVASIPIFKSIKILAIFLTLETISVPLIIIALAQI